MKITIDHSPYTNDLHVFLQQNTLISNNINENDILKIRSEANKYILASVRSTPQELESDGNCICIPKISRINLQCYLGQSARIEPFKFCQEAQKIVIAPIEDTVHGVKGDFLDIFLNSGFDFTNIPFWENMVIPVYACNHIFEFKVINCSPIKAVIVKDKNVFTIQNPVQRTNEPSFNVISYDDVGGMSQNIKAIRKVIENPITSFVLIKGPTGCGKSFL